MAIAIPGAALALSAGNGNAMAVSSPWALTLGVELVVLANIAWTLYSAFARQWLPPWPSVAITTATIAAGGLLFAAVYVADAPIGLGRLPPPAPPVLDAGLYPIVAGFGISMGLVCWNLGAARPERGSG